ncbi:hypothetical protein AO370_1424 [Moraxella catarrhalis]|uniref:Uncharacterized protein n=1 Tax=Moraxella catarrhalis TaxID=480 RepID=A0AB36DMB6_MORCA|nr:hypothetical protein AO370_1424 [Moraxella catarrhalis]
MAYLIIDSQINHINQIISTVIGTCQIGYMPKCHIKLSVGIKYSLSDIII